MPPIKDESSLSKPNSASTSESMAKSKSTKKSTILSHLVRSKQRASPYKRINSDKKRPVKTVVKYTCRYCDFETSNILKHYAHKHQHKKIEDPDMNIYKCLSCNYSSKVKGGLQRHIKRVHTKERPFTCPVCNYRTIDKQSMAKHILKNHKEDVGADADIYVNCISAANRSIEQESIEHGDGDTQEEDDTNNDNPMSEKSSSNELDPTDIADEKQANLDHKLIGGREENEEHASDFEHLQESHEDEQMDECTGKRDDDYNFVIANDPVINPYKSPKNSISSKSVQVKSKEISKSDTVHNSNEAKKSVSLSKVKKNKSNSKQFYSTPEYRRIRNQNLTCEYCHKVCSSRRGLLAHKNDHKGSGVHCPICQCFIVDPIKRSEHIENHIKELPYLCTTCLSTFALESEVVSHQQREHRKSINIIMECMFCPFSTRSLERFTRHVTRCHMFSSDVPKYNPFDVTKMNHLVAEMKTNFELDETNKSPREPSSDCVTVKSEFEHASSDDDRDHVDDHDHVDAENLEDCKVDADKQNAAYGNNDSLLDYTLLDMSAEIDVSIENIQEYLQNGEQFHGFNSSHENMSSDVIVKTEEIEETDPLNIEHSIGSEGERDDCENDSSPIDASHISWMSKNITANPIFNSSSDNFLNSVASTPKKLSATKSPSTETEINHKLADIPKNSTISDLIPKIPIQSTSSTTIPTNTTHSAPQTHQLLSPKRSPTPPADAHPPSPAGKCEAPVSLNCSRISSIASSVRPSNITNRGKRGSRLLRHKGKTLGIVPSTCPSPDSTSGAK